MARTSLERCESRLLVYVSEPFITANRKAGFLPKDRDWQHEDASEMMFDDMIKEYDMDIPRQDGEFIKALISGDQSRCRFVNDCNHNHTPEAQSHLIIFSDEKPFLFEIVSNKRNGIDVDK